MAIRLLASATRLASLRLTVLPGLRPLGLAARPLAQGRAHAAMSPIERRIDPQDRMPYTQAEFISYYGHDAVWRRAEAEIERRIDPQDGQPYTQAEFHSYYGGDEEWQFAA